MSQHRYWREASALIVASKTTSAPATSELSHPFSEYGECIQGNGLTVRMLPRHEPFDLLMLKRTQEATFMSSSFVYPCGVIEEADYDGKWIDLFTEVTGKSMKTIMEEDFQVGGPRPRIMGAKDPSFVLPPEIAFRICAIREAFIESGLFLFARRSMPHRQYAEADGTPFGGVRKLPAPLDGFNNKVWRSKVLRRPDRFLTLCRSFKVVPDIWALYEWSNWLTTAVRQVVVPEAKPHRFDTMFYLCCIDSQPDTAPDAQHASTCEWRTAVDWLVGIKKGAVSMYSPQKYEMARLTRLCNLRELSEHMRHRERLGLLQSFGVVIACNDGSVLVMHGDQLYPERPDFYGIGKTRILSCSVEELNIEPGPKHRSYVNYQTGVELFECNIELPCGYLCPDADLYAALVEKPEPTPTSIKAKL